MIRNRTASVALLDVLFPRAGTATPAVQKGSAHDFAFIAIDGTPLPLEQFRGSALLIVNTASRCGWKGQYAGLQELWKSYRYRGLVVVGVPSNDFGGQEPGNESEVRDFCRDTYGVTFPLAARTKVRGRNAHGFYVWAAETLGDAGKPRWNFHKYLVSSDGRLVAWFTSAVTPRSRRLIAAIEGALPRPPD